MHNLKCLVSVCGGRQNTENVCSSIIANDTLVAQLACNDL